MTISAPGRLLVVQRQEGGLLARHVRLLRVRRRPRGTKKPPGGPRGRARHRKHRTHFMSVLPSRSSRRSKRLSCIVTSSRSPPTCGGSTARRSIPEPSADRQVGWNWLELADRPDMCCPLFLTRLCRVRAHPRESARQKRKIDLVRSNWQFNHAVL